VTEEAGSKHERPVALNASTTAAVVPTKDRSDVPYSRAIAALYDEHYEFLGRALWRLGVDRSHIDDAIQDLFIIVFRRFDQFEWRSSVRTWLYAIALRVAKAHRRRTNRRSFDSLDETDVYLACEGNQHDAQERVEAAKVVQAIVETMDEPIRLVFTMIELEEFTAPEIALVLGISVNTVYSRLRLGRVHFDRAVERRLVTQRREK
jgi:RNA polymerase sigma-70 factor (ECF subfamily)